MNVLQTPIDDGPTTAVRMVGIGSAGRRFVQQFHTRIDVPMHTPLADLLTQQPNCVEIDTGKTVDAVDQIDLRDTQILCIVFGLDMTPKEVEVATLLVFRMRGQDGHVVGIVLGAQDRPIPDRDSTLGILCEWIDARVDIAHPTDAAEVTPLQWFYVGLQRSVLAGLSILEPAWDHSDVVEALDFGQAQLQLFTQPLDDPTQFDVAMAEVLAEFEGRGAWLEEALGAVLVLWAPSEYQLTVRVVRGLGRSLAAALGAGALHLTIRLKSRPVPEDQTAYLTLVVSSPRNRPHLLQ